MPKIRLRRSTVLIAALGLLAATAAAAIIDLTMRDFHLPGTQVGGVSPGVIQTSGNCVACHAGINPTTDPVGSWSGSLMAQAGRDPLFFAQMTTANQDVANAGYYCMRCHVPMSFVTGHANDPSGATLDETDKDGVSCHLCHSMVDPIYRPGVSPPQDEAILRLLPGGPPEFYGNSMFVLDPTGTRRGPRRDAAPLHTLITSPFHTSGNFCGTCHEVGNVAVSRNPNGTYSYNAIDEPTPTPNPDDQFPLERTYSEWKHSAFANGGVDMGGRFGGGGAGVISTCQDCHMPRSSGKACIVGPNRSDLRSHEFAGASAQVLDLIAEHTRNDPAVDQEALARGRAAAVSMLERAADVELSQQGTVLAVRVVNQTGHKLPTGHIEGRRVWINVRFLDAQGIVVGERGAYDQASAELDESTTTVFEMLVGLSPAASALTRLPAGVTGHMALADTIEKDNRIPPRGFLNDAFAQAGAPAVGESYADGQYWHDSSYAIPRNAETVEVYLYYQNTPKHYIEMLRDNNRTDHWGRTLHDLWSRTGRGAPILMASASTALALPCPADFNGDGAVSADDYQAFVDCFDAASCPPDASADFNADGFTDFFDYDDFVAAFESGC